MHLTISVETAFNEILSHSFGDIRSVTSGFTNQRLKVKVIQIPDMVRQYSYDILSTVAIVIDDENQ